MASRQFFLVPPPLGIREKILAPPFAHGEIIVLNGPRPGPVIIYGQGGPGSNYFLQEFFHAAHLLCGRIFFLTKGLNLVITRNPTPQDD